MAKKTYVVKEKDNLASLSKALGVSIRELQQANGIRNLTPGQTLTVPRNPVQKTKNQAGIYTTGENERKTVTVNGQQIRLAPNSSLDTRTPQKNRFQQFLDLIQGKNSNLSYTQMAGVGRSLAGIPLQNYDNTQFSVEQAQQIGTLNVPTVSKGGPGRQSPTNQGTGLGVNSQMGGYQQANQQTYFGSYGQGAPFSANQNMLRQQALGLVPPSQGYQYFGSYGQGAPFSANQNMLRQQALGLVPASQPQNNPYAPFFNNQQLGLQPNQFSYSPQGQQNSYTPYQAASPQQFSYAPQGQPNSYTPYSVQRQGVGETYMAAQNYQVPSLAKSALSAPPRTSEPAFNQANFQSGANRGGGGKRWWIGSGKTHGENNGAALLAAQQAAMQAINMNPGSVQQTTWRPIY